MRCKKGAIIESNGKWERRGAMEAEQRAKKRTERSGDAGSANISEEGFSLRSGCGVQPLGIDLF